VAEYTDKRPSLVREAPPAWGAGVECSNHIAPTKFNELHGRADNAL